MVVRPRLPTSNRVMFMPATAMGGVMRRPAMITMAPAAAMSVIARTEVRRPVDVKQIARERGRKVGRQTEQR